MGDNAINSGWLNTFSRTALGLISQARAKLKGNCIRNAVQKLIELEVLERFAKRTREVWFCPIGRFKPFDGISQSKLHSVEVKFEAQASWTYNLCFEYEYRGEASGLAATTASTWVHVVPVDASRLCCFEFEVSALKLALRDLPFHFGGDGRWSKFKLMPLSEAEKIKTSKFFLSINWDEIKPYW